MRGDDTRATILDVALEAARLKGLDALSIGALAKGVGMSKSGLFAHFNSKETLQLQVLQRGIEEFLREVIFPSIRLPRGEPRLRSLLERWLSWAADRARGGCLFLGAAIELDDRPGTLRDFLVRSQRDWIQTLSRAARIAQGEGHLRPGGDTDQLAFELYGIMMSFHLYQRLLAEADAVARARAAFDHLLNTYR